MFLLPEALPAQTHPVCSQQLYTQRVGGFAYAVVDPGEHAQLGVLGLDPGL